MINSRSKINNAISKVSMVPNGVENGTLSLTYQTPLEASGAGLTGTTNSWYINTLGGRNNEGDVGNMIKTLSNIDSGLSSISSSTASFTGSVDDFKN